MSLHVSSIRVQLLRNVSFVWIYWSCVSPNRRGTFKGHWGKFIDFGLPIRMGLNIVICKKDTTKKNEQLKAVKRPEDFKILSYLFRQLMNSNKSIFFTLVISVKYLLSLFLCREHQGGEIVSKRGKGTSGKVYAIIYNLYNGVTKIFINISRQ